MADEKLYRIRPGQGREMVFTSKQAVEDFKKAIAECSIEELEKQAWLDEQSRRKRERNDA